ncbi:PilN domain-containing protein [Solibacillus silvestris]|uniref:PilN domain-containing protein n=1 Tax=Solibacillus silvestris TaxID=76853 RepID=UPI003F81440B
MIPDINLMPKIAKVETSLKFAFILVGILSLITIGILAWMFYSAKNEIASATPERNSLITAHDQLQAEMASYESLNQGSLEESVVFVERISYPVTPLISETQNLLPPNTYLRSYVFSETGVQVAADFETLNAISTYVNNLENSLYFIDVQVGTILNFEIDPSGEEKIENQQFTELPRYNVEIHLIIDHAYAVAGGAQE